PAVASPAKPAAKPVATAAPAVDSRARWLQGLSTSHYVIQLLGAAEETTVKRFLAQNPSLKQVTYYRTVRQGKPWFVVVQGDYPDYEAAKTGIKRLPAAVQQQTPWVRKVDAVQKELKS
ncbi:MAG TPA: SPOR domain-containing protein, partial [Dongiaceae bacterium]|nr:SPOR domain-containing protein [Dongiaceae bacterium]